MAARGMFILGIDIGTSSVRTSLFDARGRERQATRVQLGWRPGSPAPGASEIDAELLVRRVARCIDRTLAAAGSTADRIAGVGCCSFWHSIVGVDGDGRVVTPILTWAETRPGREIPMLAKAIQPRRFTDLSGCPFHAAYWPAKLLWLRRVQPAAFARVTRWLGPAEYLYARLFGHSAMSHSTASGTGLYNRRRARWDDKLREIAGIEHAALPPLVTLGEPFTHLAKRWSKRWPILAEIPWTPPVGDGAASNVGAGCLRPGVAAIMVGTSAAVRIVPAAQPRTIPRGLWCYRIDRDWPIVGGAISNGGSVFDWLRRTLRLPRDFERRIADMGPGTSGLTALPLLMGERTPGWRTDVSGVLNGLTGRTSALEIARTFMEAVAVRCAAMVKLVDLAAGGPVRLIGSGAALASSDIWPQMIADAVGRSIEVSRVQEASLRGAALLAGQACGLIGDLPRVAGPTVGRSIRPHRRRVAAYNEIRREMSRLYDLHFG